jgi:hypothetical protein
MVAGVERRVIVVTDSSQAVPWTAARASARKEIERIVDGTSREGIKRLMDALTAATS